MMGLATGSGTAVVIDRLLAPGRRGDLFRLLAPDGCVLKRYRLDVLDADPTLRPRLQAMVARIPLQAREADGHVRVAWPLDIVLDSGRFAGFLLPLVDGNDIHEFGAVASPEKRRQATGHKAWAQGFTLEYQVTAAANLAYITQAIHEAGVVIGDFSEDMLRIASDAHVSILGCDSMQLADAASGQVFPALPRRATIQRNLVPADDLPALAASIYRLLADGESLAVNSGASANRGLAVLPSCISTMFPGAPGAPSRSAPSGAEWHAALSGLGDDIKRCDRDPLHQYWPGHDTCPWCAVMTSGLKYRAPGQRAAARVRMTLGTEDNPVLETDLDNFPRLRNAILRWQDHEFCILDIAPSFHDSEEFSVREATVNIILETPGRYLPAALRPIIWAMSPDRDVNAVHRRTWTSFSSELKQVSFNVGKDRDYQDLVEHLTAYGLKTSHAYWKLARTPGREIKGGYELCAIVKIPRACTTNAILEVNTIVERRKFRRRTEREDGGTANHIVTFNSNSIKEAEISLQRGAE
jgi:hypothetical protein